MPKIYKQNCRECGKYYESPAKYFCSSDCSNKNLDRRKKLSEATRGRIWSKESRLKISKFMKGNKFAIGRKASEETKKRMSKVQKRLFSLPENKIKHKEALKIFWKSEKGKQAKIKLSIINSGKNNHFYGKHFFEEDNWNWKGDNVKYTGLHNWVRKNLGTPDTCEICGKNGLSRSKIHWANKYHTYKRNLNDWIRLCVPCHKKYDLKRKNGKL